MGAHLYGGIPDRDIDALGRFWNVLPGLRERLFGPGDREGYSRARVGAEEVRAVVHEHDEFAAYGDRTRRVFDGWWQAHVRRLHALGEHDSPKALIRDLSEDLLERFAGLPLLDRYAVYQCLMDYWDEVMQDDVYLIVTEGWREAARPRVLVGGRGRTVESPDLKVKRTKYKMDLLPPDLVAERYFASERREIDRLLAGEEAKGRKVAAFVEENEGEDGPLSAATTATGKVTQTAVNARLRAVGDGAEDREEYDSLKACLDLMKAHGKAKRASKAAQAKLDKKVLDRYALLGGADVANIVVRDKWMASIENLAKQQVKRLTDGLVDRLRVLEDRYAEALPDLVRQVEEHSAKVEDHLRRMGLSG